MCLSISIPVLSSPTTTKTNHKHADNKKSKKELFMPASVVKAEPKVDFWIPEIKSLQQPGLSLILLLD